MEPDRPEENTDPAGDFSLTADEQKAFKSWRRRHCLTRSPEKLTWYAAEEGKIAFIKHLVSQGHGEKSLLDAAGKGKKIIVKNLIAAGVCPDVRDGNGNTPLSYASTCGRADVAAFLIKAGADIDYKGGHGYGRTALIYAVQEGETVVVNVLLKNGADSSIHGGRNYDRTPLEWAIDRGFQGILSILVEYEKSRALPEEKTVSPVEKKAVSSEWEVIGEAGQELVVHRSGDEQSGTSVKDIFDFNAGRLLTTIISEGTPLLPVEKPFSEVDPDFLKQAEMQRNSSQPQPYPQP